MSRGAVQGTLGVLFKRRFIEYRRRTVVQGRDARAIYTDARIDSKVLEAWLDCLKRSEYLEGFPGKGGVPRGVPQKGLSTLGGSLVWTESLDPCDRDRAARLFLCQQKWRGEVA